MREAVSLLMQQIQYLRPPYSLGKRGKWDDVLSIRVDGGVVPMLLTVTLLLFSCSMLDARRSMLDSYISFPESVL